MTANGRSLGTELKQFTETVRERYIVEFPHPVDTKGGYHDMNDHDCEEQCHDLAGGHRGSQGRSGDFE